MANFTNKVPFGQEPFVFLLYNKQVYSADAYEGLGWRIVFRQEVCGQHINREDGVDEAEGFFAIEQDVDYKGLLVPKVILGENGQTLYTNRIIH